MKQFSGVPIVLMLVLLASILLTACNVSDEDDDDVDGMQSEDHDDDNDDNDDNDDDNDDDDDDDDNDDTVECTMNEDCDDGEFCNGAETCVLDACVSGTDPCPDDGLWCNGTESCDEGNDRCLHSTSAQARCPDNGIYCDGLVFCNETIDACNEVDACAPGEQCDEERNTCEIDAAIQHIDGGLYSETAMVISPDGTKLIATLFSDQPVIFSQSPGKSWQWEAVGGHGKNIALAVDGAGARHLAYEESYTHELVYATDASGSWVRQVIAPLIDGDLSIAVEANGTAHICFDTGPYYGPVWYGTNKGGSWSVEQLGTQMHFDRGFVVDGSGFAHISYIQDFGNDLMYLTNQSGSWVLETVDDESELTIGLQSALTVDPDGHAHLFYSMSEDDDTTYDYCVYYATNASGYWAHENIDCNTEDQAICGYAPPMIDDDGFLHLAYSMNPGPDFWGAFRYATNRNGAWQSQIASNSVHQFASLALDPNGAAWLSYLPAYPDDTDLMIRTNASGAWVNQTVADGDYSAMYPSHMSDADGDHHLVYYKKLSNEMIYATDKTGTWSFDSISTGAESSMAQDSQGTIYISHQDWGGAGGLAVTSNGSGYWTTEIVDTKNTSGTYSSMAVDSQDRILVSHIDRAYKQLLLSTLEDGAWSTREIALMDEWGRYSSIAVDAGDHIHIAYCEDNYLNNTCGRLKYAADLSGTWTVETVDPGPLAGIMAAIAVDPTGQVHIAYGNRTDTDSTDYYSVKYATGRSLDWSIEWVEDYAYAGNAIAVDPAGRVHITYNKPELVHAVQENGAWHKYLITPYADAFYYVPFSMDDQGNVQTFFHHDYALFQAHYSLPSID